MKNWSTCLQTFEGHSDSVSSVAWSPDGRQVASSSDDRTIKIWDPATGQCQGTLEGHGGPVSSVAWSPDGRKVASASGDGTIKIWDPATGQCQGILEGHSDSASSVAWSPDGRQVASASDDRTIKIWDLATGQCKETLSDWVYSVAWSPDGRKVASASDDETIKIWDLATDHQETLESHIYPVSSVAWSPDGRKVASASYDETIKIWDPATGQCQGTLEAGHTDYLHFDTSNRIRTDAGVFELKPNAPAIDLVACSHSVPQASGYGLNDGETWITYQGQDLLWLPPEYRPSASAILGASLVLGCSSGRVLFLKFPESISAA